MENIEATLLTPAQISTLRQLANNCRSNDTLTKFACFREEADAIDAALVTIQNLRAALSRSPQTYDQAALEQIKAAAKERAEYAALSRSQTAPEITWTDHDRFLFEAACECMSPDQVTVFEQAIADDDLRRRFANCVRKRFSQDVARVADDERQAIRNEAFEEAANVCQDLGEDWQWASQPEQTGSYCDYAFAAGICARDIRARIEAPQPPQAGDGTEA
jgi:hypothetical protein